MGKPVILLASMLRFEWNLTFFLRQLSIKQESVIFQGCDKLSYNCFMQEHCKLIILDKISAYFKPRFSYLLQKVVCLIFRLFPF